MILADKSMRQIYMFERKLLPMVTEFTFQEYDSGRLGLMDYDNANFIPLCKSQIENFIWFMFFVSLKEIFDRIIVRFARFKLIRNIGLNTM